MEICGDEDLVKKYGDIVWPLEEVIMVTTGGVQLKEGVESSERVKIRYNGNNMVPCGFGNIINL